MSANAMAQAIELWSPNKLVPFDRNPRTHSASQVDQIAASIREFGFNNPWLRNQFTQSCGQLDGSLSFWRTPKS